MCLTEASVQDQNRINLTQIALISGLALKFLSFHCFFSVLSRENLAALFQMASAKCKVSDNMMKKTGVKQFFILA